MRHHEIAADSEGGEDDDDDLITTGGGSCDSAVGQRSQPCGFPNDRVRYEE